MLDEKETDSGMLTVPLLLVRRNPPRDRHLSGGAPGCGGTWELVSTYPYIPARSIEKVALMRPVPDARVPAWTVIGPAGPGPGACLGTLGLELQPASTPQSAKPITTTKRRYISNKATRRRWEKFQDFEGVSRPNGWALS